MKLTFEEKKLEKRNMITGLRLSPELYELLERIAIKNRVSVNKVVNKILEEVVPTIEA